MNVYCIIVLGSANSAVVKQGHITVISRSMKEKVYKPKYRLISIISQFTSVIATYQYEDCPISHNEDTVYMV